MSASALQFTVHDVVLVLDKNHESDQDFTTISSIGWAALLVMLG
jgi:hypothetical protein